MNRDFTRIAIVNRGEPAMRLIHSVRELAREEGRPLTTIALYTDADRNSMFVREADESVYLGPSLFTDPKDGLRKVGYLDYDALKRALVDSRAEAAWVGWGFVAEHPAFADLCAQLGIVFLGPNGDVMRRLGDKIASKQLAENAGVPVAPWSGGSVDTVEMARAVAERIGYPLMIKATAGGGGRGIRPIRHAEDLAEGFTRARSEALGAFGDDTVFMERLVDGARHIEVQVIADTHGNAWGVGLRDCSIQRRNQKIVEESSSPILTAAQEQELIDAAVRLCKEAGYSGAGTVEFLYSPPAADGDEGSSAFMEVNARLQVEHPVTELTTGLDLVKLQIQVARGHRLEGDPPPPRGCAIEVRLNAEDPENGFAPAPGKVELLRLPAGPGLRIDTGIAEGDTIASEFDSMIAKVIAHGRDRREALARLRRALADARVVVRGGTTNRTFLLDLLGRTEVVDGTADVGWLDRSAATLRDADDPKASLALLAAAIESYGIEFEAERRVFMASALRGRPRVSGKIGRDVELGYAGATYHTTVHCIGPDRFRVVVDGHAVELSVDRLGTYERRIRCGNLSHRLLMVPSGSNFLIELEGGSYRVQRGDLGVVRSPAPAVVVDTRVRAGDTVAAGDCLAVLEAMKMEMRIDAPFAGRVGDVVVRANEQVDAGAPLVRLQPVEGEEDASAAARSRLDMSALTCEETIGDEERCRRALKELRLLVLGFDVDPATSARLIEDCQRSCARLNAATPTLVVEESKVLEAFAHLGALFGRELAPGSEEFPELMQRSARENLATYMRALDTSGLGLSTLFLDSLRRTLSHYGIEGLDHDIALEEALFWIHQAHLRKDSQTAVVMAILQRRLDHVDQLGQLAGAEFLRLCDQIISVSHGQLPMVEDLAREVRYAYFDRPIFEQARDAVYAEVDHGLDELAGSPSKTRRDQLIREIGRCPQPVFGLLGQRFAGAGTSLRGVMLEALTRRFHRLYTLEDVAIDTADGFPLLTAHYRRQDRDVRVCTAWTDPARLDEALQTLTARAADVPWDVDVMTGLYLCGDEDIRGDDLRVRVEETLGRIELDRPPTHLVVSSTSPARGLGMRAQDHFTFHWVDGKPVEDPFYRGVHPNIAERLHWHRLENFELQALPSIEDVHLFHGVARENPKDERLFALAEVRDLTPLRDDVGDIVGRPQLERVLMGAVAGIRLFQGRRPPRKRLHWNRIVLYVWPELDMSTDEIRRLFDRFAPSLSGAGLEKISLRARVRRPGADGPCDTVIHVNHPEGRARTIEYAEPTEAPIQTLSPYRLTTVKMRQRGLNYPYDIVRLLTPAPDGAQSDFPPGRFVEHDLVDDELVPVERPFGLNEAKIVVGTIENYTERYPEGMKRVIVLGDPSRSLGSLAEPECSRIEAAIDLAERLQVPVEWFAVSAGAKIAMDSGVENMDWIARVLRRIVTFTQAGGEINIVVHGINVGAQPYWNAEATMLMHTRGVLIMTDQAAMVLTGKQALDFSGGVSAEDNFGIGGYDRIMGPNGQAQYGAATIEEACGILFRHYEHTYVEPGESFPRRSDTVDPKDRDVTASPYVAHDGTSFSRVGDVFSDATNPGRKKPFDIRQIMRAVVDQDHEPLERWAAMRDAEIGVAWDATLGGHSVCMVGLESRPLRRAGFVPADGPEHWTAGTLFPRSSKKVARAINAASNNRPLVVLANLSGFDGSPDSMRSWQLEYGAEIGRAVVNFQGPILFVVISRYHGGAFVVFSQALNDQMEIAALEGTYASVIGGAPAAAVVFAREVNSRTKSDPRVSELDNKLREAQGAERGRLAAELRSVYQSVRSEKLGMVADEFDGVHNVERAQRVGAVHRIISPKILRSYLIDGVERGQRGELGARGRQEVVS